MSNYAKKQPGAASEPYAWYPLGGERIIEIAIAIDCRVRYMG